MKASSGCLGENTIDALGRRALSPEARQAAVDHLDRCEDCRLLIAAVGHDTIAVAPTLSGLSSSSEVDGPARAQLRAGDRVGRYTVLHKVGAGGMGVVFAAYDPQLDRRVALKLVHHGVLSAGSWEIAAARLLREAQALARLSHPNVITVFDAGRFEGLVFLAMELLADGTLGQWLDAQPRAPALIVQRFLEAGRGLAAAHAAGIVHRDFKPDNVLVGNDGHARVTDFGLARVASHGSDDGSSPAPRPLLAGPSAPTLTGAVLGTPAYMAPELWHGAVSDAQSDQFAYCVALYEALHGKRPFSLAALADADTHGLVAPRGERMSPALHAVLARGLHAVPAQRFPSMPHLLDAITATQARPRRRAWTLAIGGVTIAAIAAVIALWPGSTPPAICRAASASLVGIWDPGQQLRIAAAFQRGGSPIAGPAWATTRSLLDRYATGWTQMHTEACEATHVRGEQSGELLDLRMACLGQRRDRMRALVTLLITADADVVERSVHAVAQLPPLDECASREALTAPLALPAAPPARARIAAVRTQLAEAAALLDAGRYAPSRALAQGLVAEAEALGYRPVQAEVFMAIGVAHVRLEQPADAAPALHRALVAAQASGHLIIAARAALSLAFVDGLMRRQHAAGHVWLDLAGATVERIGDAPALAADHAYVLGNLLHDEHEPARALVELERAREIQERTFGAEHPRVANTLARLGTVLVALERLPEAVVATDRALAIHERLLGPDHPSLSSALHASALVLLWSGRSAEAATRMERALALEERAFGPDHPALVKTLTGLATVRDDPEISIPLLLRARQIQIDAVGTDHPDMAEIEDRLALHYGRRGDAKAQLAHARHALQIREQQFGPAHVDLAQPLSQIGQALITRGDPAGAIPPLERALALVDGLEGHVGSVDSRAARIELRLALGDAIWAVGRDRARAHAVVKAARELARRGDAADSRHVATADRWLSVHPWRPAQ